MLRRQVALACFMSLTLTLTGCALSPQQLTPNPVMSADLPSVGQGKVINLKVVDGRSSTVLGTRGGLYANTSTISVANDAIAPKLKVLAEKALTKMGYKIGENGTPLTITISELTYKAPDSYFVRSATVSAMLSVQLQTATKTYNGRYSASVNQDFSSAPDLETNTNLVSEVLGNALSRMLKDTDLTSKVH